MVHFCIATKARYWSTVWLGILSHGSFFLIALPLISRVLVGVKEYRMMVSTKELGIRNYLISCTWLLSIQTTSLSAQPVGTFNSHTFYLVAKLLFIHFVCQSVRNAMGEMGLSRLLLKTNSYEIFHDFLLRYLWMFSILFWYKLNLEL